jgi:acetoin utilization protein AcuB
MLVRDIMSSPALAIPAGTTLEDAYRTMREKGIRHFPVLEDDRLVGVVTDRDLRLATSSLAPTPFPPFTPVSAVMSHPAVTADGADPVEDAARTMRERKIGCLPVVDDGKLVGIITGLDLLDALMRMTGVDKPSGRLEVRLPDTAGALARLMAALSERGLGVYSILSYADGPHAVRTVLRIGTIEMRSLAHDLRLAEFDVLWPPEKAWLR